MSAITRPASYITFRLGAELFAIDVVQVREVLDLTQITRVPTAPDYMRGVVNVRGSTVPVVDMRRKFGLAPGPDTVNTRIVVLELGLDGERAVVGGLADSVHDVIELEPAQITDPPRIAMRWRTDVIRGMGKQGEQFIIILDIDKVFAADGGLLVETAQAGLAAVEASAS
jgi:purine-binding chemotaxis protein CheW